MPLPEVLQESLNHVAEKDPAAYKLLVDRSDAALEQREVQMATTAAYIAVQIGQANTPKARTALELQHTAALERERNPLHPGRTSADQFLSEAIKPACLALFPVAKLATRFLDDKLFGIDADEAALAEKHGVPQSKVATSLREYVLIAKRQLEGWQMEARRSYGHPLFRTHLPSFIATFAHPRAHPVDPYASIGIDPSTVAMRNRRTQLDCEQQAKDADEVKRKNARIAGKLAKHISRRAFVDSQHLPIVDVAGPVFDPTEATASVDPIGEETVTTIRP